ncbi:late competence protein ComER [Ferviditalea candida]|uniref:Pyrroline-5-carboxylate reductase n=1 Tax=Ferviditalea candida TaxID=3108399 RepID=A0ABU5ZE00_9BACL|nr:late competence protein ComER [Paenibacillaceae bacterium T2]
MNVGFIGTGSMGSILIEAFIRSNALHAEQIIAGNRTRSKAEKLAEQYPGIRVADSNAEIAADSTIVFICVKPMEYKKVIDEISGVMSADQIVVSITSPVLIKHLEEMLPCKIAKVIPSITNYELSGATLCMYGNRMGQEDRELLESLLKQISTPMPVSEQYTRIISDLSSCGPAFLAFFIRKFIEAAVAKTGIPEAEATLLASQMVVGTGKLLTSGGFTPETLERRVAVPGGITEAALKLLERELCGVFDQLVDTTHEKYDEDLLKVEMNFLEQQADQH